jgi:hypothetical protein
MNGQPQPYQSLTSENAALVLVAHQVGLVTGVHSGHNARTHGQVRGPDPSGKKSSKSVTTMYVTDRMPSGGLGRSSL